MANDAVVKPVPRRPFFDVFVGKGWRNWTRVHRDRNGVLTVIAGLQLDGAFLANAINSSLQKDKAV